MRERCCDRAMKSHSFLVPKLLENSLSTQKGMGTCFESGNDKATKGEGLAPPFICCAKSTMRVYSPLPLRPKATKTIYIFMRAEQLYLFLTMLDPRIKIKSYN